MPKCKPIIFSDVQERFGKCKTLDEVRTVEVEFSGRFSPDVIQKHSFRIKQIILLGYVMIEDVTITRRL